MIDLLIKTFENAGIPLTSEQGKLMSEFFDLLVETNSHTNLTRITTPEDAVLKHFLDSAMGKEFISPDDEVLDIGSGGGFPSIPLAILNPNSNFTLVDSTGKKVDFLNSVAQKLPLKNVRALHERAEELGQKQSFRESFDVVSARAVASLPTLLEYCLPFVRVGGLFLAYKTEEDEISLATHALSELGGKLQTQKTYALGELGDKRTIFVIQKVAPTPIKYPRGQGKPRTKPL